MSALNKLYAAHKKQVEFFVIYIREAHAADSDWPDRRTHVLTPRSIIERARVAQTCTSELKLKLPMLIDGMKNGTERAYCAWPDRLFLVGRDGKIAYRGGRGPRGFKPTELKKAIEAELKTRASKPAR